jgi:hypothetical protein
MAQQVVLLCFSVDILQENRGRLDQLNVDIPVVEIQNPYEMLHHVVLAKYVEVVAFVLLGEDHVLSQSPNNLNIEMLIAFRNFNDV